MYPDEYKEKLSVRTTMYERIVGDFITTLRYWKLNKKYPAWNVLNREADRWANSFLDEEKVASNKDISSMIAMEMILQTWMDKPIW